jgi:translation initiation factor 2B subunit (eIF-2B alpha/beta/delta family)
MTEELPKNIRISIDQIRSDNTSGSAELAKQSAELLISLVQTTDSLAHLKHAGYLLLEAQPTMASIFNLVNTLLFTIDRKNHHHGKLVVTTYCQQFIHDLETSDTAIRTHTMNLIKNNATILTHSYSSTILSALLFAKRNGKQFSVICTESRPINEGANLAEMLGKKNIPVTLVVDAAVFSCIPDADIILVGGDALLPMGLINKIGTKGIAMAAHQNNTPLYALCSTIKFLPPTYPVPLNQQKNPQEILHTTISNVTAQNYYFDCTPLDYLTGVITEQEILTPPTLVKRLQQLTVHPDLSKNASV